MEDGPNFCGLLRLLIWTLILQQFSCPWLRQKLIYVFLKELKARKKWFDIFWPFKKKENTNLYKNKSWCPEWGHIQEHSAKRAIRAIVQNARRLLYCKITRQITAAPIYKITLRQYRVCRFQEKDTVWTTNSVTFGYNWNRPRSHLGAMTFWAQKNLDLKNVGPCMKIPYDDFHAETEFLGAQIS